MSFFMGKFYAVTAYSVWEVDVQDLNKTPLVRKMGYQGGKIPVVVPVGGSPVGGFYVAITAEGLIKYCVKRHQRAHVSPQTLRPRVEQLERRMRRGKTHSLKGLFMKRDDADACLEAEVADPFEVFDRRWHDSTRDVLTRIGHFHPLISISTEREFAVPSIVLPLNDCMGTPS